MASRRSAVLGLALAAAGGRGAATGSAPACPADLEPYLKEASPFGWPVAPAEFQFGRPECWAEKYPLCAGDRQSPMNLDFTLTNAECRAVHKNEDGALADQARYVTVASPVLTMSEYMRSVSMKGALGSLKLKDADGHDVEYEATSAHLTSPALHAMNGERAAAELMIVHKPKGEADALRQAVVVSVLFKDGDDSAFFTQLGFVGDGQDNVHKDRDTWQVPSVDLGGLTDGPLHGKSLSYDGSVPLPPCTENVRWIILAEQQGVGAGQIQSLQGQLIKHTGGIVQRPLVKRDPNEICREISENSLAAPVSMASDCTRVGNRTAECWSQKCDMSPVPIRKGEADVSLMSMPADSVLHYVPAQSVVVAPSAMSLDAKGHFGHVLVGGRSFEAKKVSVKAISTHAVDGVRYAGELLVEHTLFGDDLAADATPAHRRLESESSNAATAAALDGTRGVHKIVVSVPLKLGRESPLLRSLGLGVEAHREAIRHGNSYTLPAAVNLATELQASTSSEWYWYSGGPTTPGLCPAWGVKWMVFSEPLEVSIEQLNFLSLPVSGMDSTPVARRNTRVYYEAIPQTGIAMGSCDHDDHLLNDPACWTSAVAACGGSAQSPIDIRTSVPERVVGDESFLNKCSWKPVTGLRMFNNGHSLGFENNQLGYTTVIGENGFPKFYQVTGVALKMPSEHTLNGKHFPAELQVIQKNQKTVIEYDDEDMIISSIFFEFGEESKLLKQMLGHGVAAPGEYVTLDQPLDLQWALGPVLDGNYYRYEGSLTTPGCNEVVQWAIFETPLSLSVAQWQVFKAAFPNPGNNRPLQALNGRAVVQNTMAEAEPVDYKFFLNREMGRDKRETNPALIAFPIIGTVLLCSISMFAIFQREDAARKAESAGGLEATTVGYGRL